MSDTAQPFRIETPQADLDDLKRRLTAARFPEAETVSDWSQGIPLNYVKELAAYWAGTYDWRACENRLNAWPQFKTTLDGLDIHFLHIRSPEANARPLLMTHGWPGSVLEFIDIIGPLTNPAAHGGTAADAFHLVCPSLPGFGYSDKPAAAGWGVSKIADRWDALMRRLGYDAYFAQGGDWGSVITMEIGTQNKGACKGIHITMPLVQPDPETMNDLTSCEQDALAAFQHYQDWDSGYSKQQSTRPQTIGYGLCDSPVGQLAWIMEKFWAWTDCGGHPENAIARDRLLDNVTLYWLTASAASSARIYWESFTKVGFDPINIPSAISMFPKEIYLTSKRWAERRFTDLRYFNELAKGGHFAAMEQPETFVVEVRSAVRSMD